MSPWSIVVVVLVTVVCVTVLLVLVIQYLLVMGISAMRDVTESVTHPPEVPQPDDTKQTAMFDPPWALWDGPVDGREETTQP